MSTHLLKSARHIAIIRRNGLGDLLCAMPLVAYCRRHAPDAIITLIADRRNAPLLPYLQGFDHSVIWPKGNKYLGALTVGVKHWWPRVDVAIAAKPTPTRLMSFALWTIHARHRLGVVDASTHCRLINHPTPLTVIPEGSIHQSLAILRLVDPKLESVPEDLYPKFKLPKALQTDVVDPMRQRLSVGQKQNPILLVSISTSRAANALGVAGYSVILNRLAQDHSFRVVVSCEPRDLAKAQDLVSQLRCDAIALPTHTIDELVALLSLVDIVFVGDGGVMHLSAALDKPMVALFGRNGVTQWGPLSTKALTLCHPENVLKIPQELILKALNQKLVS